MLAAIAIEEQLVDKPVLGFRIGSDQKNPRIFRPDDGNKVSRVGNPDE